MIVLIIILVLVNIGSYKTGSIGSRRCEEFQEVGEKSNVICPLCESYLKKGERIHSAVYPGETERTVHVYGCPYCYKKAGSKNLNTEKYDPKKVKKRACPVCSRNLKENDYLIGRMWDTEVKTHLKVIGCIKCRKHPI